MEKWSKYCFMIPAVQVHRKKWWILLTRLAILSHIITRSSILSSHLSLVKSQTDSKKKCPLCAGSIRLEPSAGTVCQLIPHHGACCNMGQWLMSSHCRQEAPSPRLTQRDPEFRSTCVSVLLYLLQCPCIPDSCLAVSMGLTFLQIIFTISLLC